MTQAATNNNHSVEIDKLGNSIPFVNDLFRKINDNSLIPSDLKTVISKLKKQYNKIARETPKLFVFENHQARIFLEALCQLSIDWKEIKDRKNEFLSQLESTIDNLNEKEHYNNNHYLQSQKDIEKFFLRLKKKSAIREKRRIEKQIAEKKMAQAKEESTKIITQKLSKSKEVSPYIKSLLSDDWAKLLELLYIKHGPQSEIYQSNLEFIDLLLEINKQKINDINSLQFDTVCDKYHNGLTHIAFNKLEIKDKRLKLLEYLKSLQQTKSSNETSSIKPSISSTQYQKPIQAKDSENSSNKVNTQTESQSYQQKLDFEVQVSNLKKDSWIEIIKADSRQKAKLSWVSPVGSHLFVDSTGRKIANLSKADLMKGLHKNIIKIIEDPEQ